MTRTVALIVAALMLAIACASGGDDGGFDEEEFSQQLEETGGEVVDNTTIVTTRDSDTIDLAGIQLTHPLLAEYRYPNPEDNNRGIPPVWPLLHRAVAIPSGEEAQFFPALGFGVLAQTTLATDPERRAELVEQASTFNGLIDDAPVAHQSEITNPDTNITCYTETRSGDHRRLSVQQVVPTLFFYGPGRASIVISMNFTGDESFDLPAFVGDLVENVCGQRPEGL